MYVNLSKILALKSLKWRMTRILELQLYFTIFNHILFVYGCTLNIPFWRKIILPQQFTNHNSRYCKILSIFSLVPFYNTEYMYRNVFPPEWIDVTVFIHLKYLSVLTTSCSVLLKSPEIFWYSECSPLAVRTFRHKTPLVHQLLHSLYCCVKWSLMMTVSYTHLTLPTICSV